MPSPRHSVSVAAAVIRGDGQALLVRRRDNGRWEPPGGVLELDETIEDGLIREVQEETGLTVKPERLTGVYKNMARGIIALVFHCRPVAGTLTLNDEVAEFRWASDAELDDLMDAAYAARVHDALAYHGQAAIRTHDGVQLLA